MIWSYKYIDLTKPKRNLDLSFVPLQWEFLYIVWQSVFSLNNHKIHKTKKSWVSFNPLVCIRVCDIMCVSSEVCEPKREARICGSSQFSLIVKMNIASKLAYSRPFCYVLNCRDDWNTKCGRVSMTKFEVLRNFLRRYFYTKDKAQKKDVFLNTKLDGF